MSGYGTKRTCLCSRRMSGVEGGADLAGPRLEVRFDTRDMANRCYCRYSGGMKVKRIATNIAATV
jgi:hypothetical protein